MLLDWLKRKVNKYTSHEIQNEIIKIKAMHVLRVIADCIHQSPIMLNEIINISNCEQATVVIR